ncbi:MAG: archaeosortase/exosortase family protein, partial [Phycisphaerales bacterium]
PVALVVNIVRVLVLGLLSLIDPDLGTGEVHTMVGVFLLVPAWLLFLGVAEILKRLVVDSADDATNVGVAP